MSKEEKERAKANKESADAKKQEAQHSKTVSQETKKTLDNVKETGNQYKVINDEFQSYADAINAANLEIQGSTSYLRKAQKEYDGLTSLANKLADNQKEFNELSVEDLKNIKDKSEERRKELALLEDGLKLEEEQLEKDLKKAKVGSAAARAIESRLEKTRALLAANADGLVLESSITKQAQEQLDLEAKIASKAGLTGSLIKSAEGAMKKLGIESKIVNDAFSEANAEMRKMVIEAHQSGKGVSSASVAAKAEALANAIFAAQEKFDNAFVSETDEKICILRPKDYYDLLAGTQESGFSVINRDYDGAGSYADGKVLKIGGVTILKTPNLPSTNVAQSGAATGIDYYHYGDFSKTVGVIFSADAIGVVRLLGLGVQTDYQVERQGTLMVARQSVGIGTLRPECAVELKIA